MFLFIPFFGAAGVFLAGYLGKKAVAFYVAFIVLLTAFFIHHFARLIVADAVINPYIPLRLDGLSLTFASLILFIGLLIILYAAYYFDKEPSNVRFFTLFLIFMGSMLGVVFSDHLIVLIIFWEMTSLVSFLLIAYWHDQSSAREGAIIALSVTAFGGLTLLAATLLLAHTTGSFSLTVILQQGDVIKNSPYYPWILALFLVGVFTKSAQFPFHFWLPGAMHAPTPVSAYLHSATLVKAGIFLLARFYPALAGTPLWFYLVTFAGLATFIFGAYSALSKNDLKSLLAYSTISHLGLITTLFGYGTPNGAVAGIFHLFNHSAFKASLFMAAGIIDHECGTRDMRRLGGLYRFMPATTILALVATGSMAGVPLLNGFLSKELFFDETLRVARSYFGVFRQLWWLLPLLVTVGSLFSVAYSLRFALEVFFGKPVNMPKQPHDPALWVRIPVTILVLLCILVGTFPQTIITPLLTIAAQGALLVEPPTFDLKVWHGFSWPFMMSIAAIGGGILLYRSSLFKRLQESMPRFSAVTNFHAFFRGVLYLAHVMTPNHDHVRPVPFWGVIFTFIFGALAVAISTHAVVTVDLSFMLDNSLMAIALMVFVAVAAVLRWRQHRLLAIFALSIAGLGTALLFAHLSAPDLAFTQMLIEMATLLFILLALTHLPAYSRKTKPPAYAAPLAIMAAMTMGVLTFLVVSSPPSPDLAMYFAANAALAGGKNLVNLILVDFRGFDTFGETLVMAIALLGVLTLARSFPKHPASSTTYPEGIRPLMLAEMSRIVFPLAVLMAFFLFLRGHQEPGGGFAAALLLSGGIMLLYLGHGVRFVKEHFPNPFHLVVTGIVFLLVSGLLAPFFANEPFLKSFVMDVDLPLLGHIHIVTSMVFDLGVWFTVTGVLWLLFQTLVEL